MLVIGLVALSVFFMTILYSRSLTPVFAASASMEVTKKIASEGMDRFLYYKGHPMETAMRQIKSRLCIEAALRKLKLITDESTEKEISGKVSDILSRLSTNFDPNTNVLVVTLKGPDRDNLVSYVNAICEVYATLEKQWNQQDDQETIDFLNQQIEKYHLRLQAAEQTLIDFKSQNITEGINEDLTAQVTSRTALTLEIEKIKEEMEEIRNRHGAWSVERLPEYQALVMQQLEAEKQRNAALNQFTENHPSYLRANDELERIAKEIENRKEEFATKNEARIAEAIADRQERLIGLNAHVDRILNSLSRLSEGQVQAANHEMELALARSLYQMFWQRMEQQKITMASKTGGVVFHGPANGTSKIFPNEATHQSMGGAMGLLLGLAFAFLLETMDTSIRTIEEIEEFAGVPVLGVAPLIVIEPMDTSKFEPGPGRPQPNTPGSVVHFHPRDPTSEAYRGLASTLDFVFFNDGHRVLLVASATPQEGKTTSVSNIGIALANSGKKTLVIDCNLRHPGITKIFGLSGHAGMAEILANVVPAPVCIYPTAIENLDIIPTGALPGHPVELIKSGLPALLRELSSIYAAVVIDSPPILPVADASIISSMAGGTLLIYSQGKAPRDVLLRAKSKIETAKGRVIGTFLNKVKPEGELGRNYYYYYYAYYPSKKKKAIVPPRVISG